MLTAQLDDPFDRIDVAVLATITTPILVFLLLLLALGSKSQFMTIQRQQVEELARLRREVAKLRQSQPATTTEDEIGELPRIGAPEHVFQIGDRVAVIDGPHRGDHGTVAPTPDWVRQGFICVDLVRERGQRYMPVSKLERLDQAITD